MRYPMVIGAALREVISAEGGPVSNDGLTPGFRTLRRDVFHLGYPLSGGRGYLEVTKKTLVHSVLVALVAKR
jgi:hypothetical protein